MYSTFPVSLRIKTLRLYACGTFPGCQISYKQTTEVLQETAKPLKIGDLLKDISIDIKLNSSLIRGAETLCMRYLSRMSDIIQANNRSPSGNCKATENWRFIKGYIN